MKLEAYQFKMKWELKHSHQCDYGLRHPPEDNGAVEADDEKKIVNCILEYKLKTSITRKLWRIETLKDLMMQAQVEDKLE